MRIASKIIAISGLLASASAAADQVVSDNLIIQGGICAGFDCVNGEAFVDDNLRLKENNLRIRFDDTSLQNGVLGESWNISANDTANGGEAYIGIELKSRTADFFFVSDGTAPLYDCSDLNACFITNGCPVIGVIPVGEPITDAFCNELAPVYTTKSMFKLTTDNVRSADEVEDGVAIGYESDEVPNAVSVGRSDLARRIANVAEGIGDSSVLIQKLLTGYVPYAQQVAMIDDLNQQLDTIDLELNDVEAVIFDLEVDAVVFNDVAADYWALSFIKILAATGITSGCGNGNFCPNDEVTRAQMAVFLIRARYGSNFAPPPATGNIFLDVAAGDFAAAFVEQLFLDRITSGCGNGNFCPNDEVTRAQMAVFLLRAKYGSDYTPPPPTGVFGDVAPGSFAAGWIEQLAAEGITSGCGGGNYCPSAPVSRAQMAVFIVRAFGL